MRAFPNPILTTSTALTLVATLCISCHKPEKESMQQLAESFFREFSIALANDDAAKASAMIAGEKRERFRKGFRFWQGVHFFDPLVIKVSENKTLIEVEVSFKKEQGKQDREIKKLKFTDGKWLLLDS